MRKRTFRNQELGPFIYHEMNRCIQCYRCVRFYRKYAGGRDLDVSGIHNHLYYGRFEDGTLESEFSGNLVEICPTGVFTDKTLRKHFTRKWDLQTAPSVCVHCGAGCNTIPGERYGKLRRILNRYNHEVNGYFLCDRGRFGYEFVNSDRRIRRAHLRPGTSDRSAELEPSSKEAVVASLEGILANGKRPIGIGSPRASLEANFALRSLVGPDRFYTGMPESESALVSLVLETLTCGPAVSVSLREVELCDAVLVLGEDVPNTSPRLALSLRQSVRRRSLKIADKHCIPLWNDRAVRKVSQEAKSPLFLATVAATRLDDISAATFNGTPDEIARLGYAVAHELDPAAPPVEGSTSEEHVLAACIAGALKAAERPLVVSGTGCGSEAVIIAAAQVAAALHRVGKTAGLSLCVPECNTLGVGLIGGGHLEAAFKEVTSGAADTVVILENDLFRRADAKLVAEFFKAATHVIAIDHLFNQTASHADLLLPAATFAEADGTFINAEGRAQRSYRVFPATDEIRESWRWLYELMQAAGKTDLPLWTTPDDVCRSIAESIDALKPLGQVAPPADFRVAGLKIPRQPHRYSGRTAMTAQVSVHEPAPARDADSALAFSMEGFHGHPPNALLDRYWAPGWNSVQALNKFQSEVGGPLRGGDPGIRVLEPAPDREATYPESVPEAFSPRAGERLIVPLYHVFGSEELSAVSPGIAERSPGPYLGLSPDDAESIGVDEGRNVRLTVADVVLVLPVRLIPSLPQGVTGLSVGLGDLPYVQVPAWGVVTRAKAGD